MAFAQQQRRPRYHSHTSFTSTSSVEDQFISPSPTISILSPGPTHNNSNTVGFSDSENDWHIISSATTRSSSSTTTTSNTPAIPPILERRDSVDPSEPESYSSFRLSDDTESFSDGDFNHLNNNISSSSSSSTTNNNQHHLIFNNLPAHDGTGTFNITSEEDDDDDGEESSSLSTTSNNNKMVLKRRASFKDFEPSSSSMPNILLPYGGIHLPTFIKKPLQQQQQSPSSPDHTQLNQVINSLSPHFQPTVMPEHLILSSDEEEKEGMNQQYKIKEKEEEDSNTTFNSSDHIKFTRRRRRNLDSIPTHHPSIPGTMTSFAILSAIWNNLRRLTNHLIENDTNTADAFTSLVSEGTLEGCLPFGSHLHMELSAGLRPAYTNRHWEGLPGM